MSSKAVFLDKDGVMNHDLGIEGSRERTSFMPFIGEAIAHFRSRDYRVIVVTNQPIVARGLMSERELQDMFRTFERELALLNPAAVLDKIYYCPHHPNANVETYRVACDCRKPKPGMLVRAAREFDIDLAASFMVGDRISDIIAGSLAGCTTIQFLSGKHTEQMIHTDLAAPSVTPDHTIHGLAELTEIIL